MDQLLINTPAGSHVGWPHNPEEMATFQGISVMMSNMFLQQCEDAV